MSACDCCTQPACAAPTFLFKQKTLDYPWCGVGTEGDPTEIDFTIDCDTLHFTSSGSGSVPANTRYRKNTFSQVGSKCPPGTGTHTDCVEDYSRGAFGSPDANGCGFTECVWDYDDSSYKSVLSSPYTKSDFLTDVAAAIAGASYSGGFSGSNDASLSDAGGSKFKFKIQHPPTATCYLKAWLRTRFRPAGGDGSSDVLTDIGTPYEWIGSDEGDGTCIPDPTHSVNDAANLIIQSDGDAIEVLPASSDFGTTTIEVKKWTCMQGYEPADPNADGTRPNPDTNPNGFPQP